MKILLIKLKNIGDVLIMTPAIRGIRERHPEARISVLVRAGTEGILAGCKDIDEVQTQARVWVVERSQKHDPHPHDGL